MGLSIAGIPLLYLLIRSLFKFVLKVFYSSIIIENGHFVPSDGVPCILCANHSNSLTDALIMMTSIPLSKRKWLRMTAKDTLFGKKTFSSWLIESVGTVPVKRAKDYEGKRVDNTQVFSKLMDAIDKQGDMVCLFPEGISHYSSYIAPLRSGVARITSDVLNRNLDNPDFELTLLTCSITYLHRESFRSDVLVSFNPPIKINVREHKELFASPALSSSSQTDKLDGIKQLTALMQEQIRHGTIDAPNFGVVRIANTARRLYAPLGTGMTLGDHVHITQRFVDAFAKRQTMKQPATPAEALMTPLPTANTSALATTSELAVERHPGTGYFDFDKASTNGDFMSDEEVEQLANDLHAYQDTLNHLWIKDDRIRKAPANRSILFKRFLVRMAGGLALLTIAAPGLVLWLPVFATAGFYGWRMRTSGRIEDVWDEIAHTKLIYGLLSGVIVWALAVLLTLPFALFTSFLVPVLMWFSLRWFEDALSSFRAAIALLSLLAIGPTRLAELRTTRSKLHERVMKLARSRAELPQDPDKVFDKLAKDGLYERGGKVGRLGFFSVRRRRKKDYNEIMRLWDQAEYPMR